jgi:starch synthase (maltosyl-transferring)
MATTQGLASSPDNPDNFREVPREQALWLRRRVLEREQNPAAAGSSKFCSGGRDGADLTQQHRHAVTGKLSISSSRNRCGERIYIEDVYPLVDGGRFPVKRIADEPVDVWADIFRDGHAVLAADLLWRLEGSSAWQRAPMRLHSNDRWSATFTPMHVGRYLYAIEAWTDVFATWRRDFQTKRAAGLTVALELEEWRLLLRRLKMPGHKQAIDAACRGSDAGDALLSEELAQSARSAERTDLSRSPEYPFIADRPVARASAWYEMVPRSQASVAGEHGTFDDCIRRLPDIAALGFDVLYFPPIHPIGGTNRKGRNNALRAEPGDPGSPYAIGSAEGGHDALHPQLGSLDDFRRLVAACAGHGLEVALDFAIQCSPDHPWLGQHPEWFKRRPDGSIQYAENPPKKYEDIVNPEFYGTGRDELWKALRDVVLFWVRQGVRIFRVDNPHTKPFPFWEWLIC